MIKNLREFVTFQRDNGTQDGNGQYIPNWQNITNASNVPCSVEHVTGGEVRRGRQMQATATLLLRCVHPFGAFTLTTADSVSYDSRRLNIVDVYDPDETNRELHIQCKESV